MVLEVYRYFLILVQGQEGLFTLELIENSNGVKVSDQWCKFRNHNNEQSQNFKSWIITSNGNHMAKTVSYFRENCKFIPFDFFVYNPMTTITNIILFAYYFAYLIYFL